MKLPIIFLDFDGVLNSLGCVLMPKGRKLEFNPISVGLVDRLCIQTDARIVISSSWRIGSDLDGLRQILRDRTKAAVLHARVIGLTPRLSLEPRGKEIDVWMRSEGIAEGHPYVILDDDSDMLPEQLPHFVKTKYMHGFSVREYWQALRLLAPDHRDVKDLAAYCEPESA